MDSLTIEEQSTNFITMRHIEMVRNCLNKMIVEILNRQEKHDQSKLEQPEVGMFTEFTSKLAGCTYGSDEYNQYKKLMGSALSHHYCNNRHHPEFHKNGINDMNLIDLVEMFCDWYSASKRHNDGNINKSIEINGRRFDISPQLIRIFENSVDLL